MNSRSPIALTPGEMPARAAETAAREKRRDVFLFGRAQAAAGETVARDQVDVGARDLRKLLRDAIVEREAERDGAQDFGLGELRGLRRNEEQLAVDRARCRGAIRRRPRL